MTEHGAAQTQRACVDWRLPRSVEAAQRLGIEVLAVESIFLVLIALGWAVWSVGVELLASIGQTSFERFKAVTTEILAIFIFMEIFTLLMEYVRSQRLRLTNLVDATLAVILRELWVRLYGGHVEAEALVSIPVVLATLAVLRAVSVRFSVEGARPVA